MCSDLPWVRTTISAGPPLLHFKHLSHCIEELFVGDRPVMGFMNAKKRLFPEVPLADGIASAAMQAFACFDVLPMFDHGIAETI